MGNGLVFGTIARGDGLPAGNNLVLTGGDGVNIVIQPNLQARAQEIGVGKSAKAYVEQIDLHGKGTISVAREISPLFG